MLSPRDLNLPEKFTEWRPSQLETAAKVAGSSKYGFLLDAPTGVGKCVREGTYVWTAGGVSPVEDCCSNEVISYKDYSFLLSASSPPVDLGVMPTVRAVTDCGYSLEGAKDHNVVVLREKGLQWCSLGGLRVGDYVPIYVGGCQGTATIPTSCPIPVYERVWGEPYQARVPTISVVPQDELGYFLGLWVAEGDYVTNRIDIANTCSEVLSFLDALGNKIGIPPTPIIKDGTIVGRSFNSVVLVEWLKGLGCKTGAKNKSVPSIIFSCPSSVIWAFLSGYFDGEGNAERSAQTITASSQLSVELPLLYLSVGTITITKERRVSYVSPITGEQSRAWTTTVCSVSHPLLRNMSLLEPKKKTDLQRLVSLHHNPNKGAIPYIGEVLKEEVSGGRIPRSEYKHAAMYWSGGQRKPRPLTPQMLRKYLDLAGSTNGYLRFFAEQPIFVDKIKLIQEGQGKLFEVEVSGAHTYISNGFISHNSLIAAAVQKLIGKNTVYLVSTKQLQDQLLYDFPYAKSLKGRANYPCLLYKNMFPDVTAELCTHSKDRECKLHNKCPYIIAKRAALSAPLAVLNVAYFLSEVNFVGSFTDREILVADEFDLIEDQLMSFVELSITQRQLKRLEIPPPKYKTKFESWVDWAKATYEDLTPELHKLEKLTDSTWGGVDIKALKRKTQLSRLVSKLKFFIKEVDKNWVWYPGEDKWSFKPVWINKYAAGVLWNHTAKVLGMSATILDPRQSSLNVGFTYGGRRSYDYVALPSPFPKENRPVYYEPCANVINRLMDIALPRLAKAVGRILEKHPNDRILVHTVSYKVRDYLMKSLPGKRLLTHSIVDRAAVLERFKKSADPLVLISPSMDRGIDLPDEECRVVIIAKCPYPDLSDPQVNKRVHASKDGNSWYAHRTISTIVQMAGRACRSETDYATTYILDEQFQRLYNEHRQIFPQWFKEAIVI